MTQLGFADYEARRHLAKSRTHQLLSELDKLVSWDQLSDKLSQSMRKATPAKKKAGRPSIPIKTLIKMLVLQNLYGLSDPELEEQTWDRLSFQHFVGLDMSDNVPDFSSVWRFKEKLIKLGLSDYLFESVLSQLEAKGLLIKRGTLVDATIIPSSTRPLSHKKRKELELEPSHQVDTDAQSTRKNNRYYFGYKGHTGVDQGSKLIHSQVTTPANVHDSQKLDELLHGQERAYFADKAYGSDGRKRLDRETGRFNGLLDKARRNRRLSASQKKRNKRLSSIRAQVEHPYAVIQTVQNYGVARAKTLARNALAFSLQCAAYNLRRGAFLCRA